MTSLNPSLRLALISKAKAQKSVFQKGFTLVELLIVVVILGVLTSIALPTFLSQADQARINGANTAAKSAANACAASIVAGTNADFVEPEGITESAGGCKIDATYESSVDGLTTQAIATVSASEVSVKTAVK